MGLATIKNLAQELNSKLEGKDEILLDKEFVQKVLDNFHEVETINLDQIKQKQEIDNLRGVMANKPSAWRDREKKYQYDEQRWTEDKNRSKKQVNALKAEIAQLRDQQKLQQVEKINQDQYNKILDLTTEVDTQKQKNHALEMQVTSLTLEKHNQTDEIKYLQSRVEKSKSRIQDKQSEMKESQLLHSQSKISDNFSTQIESLKGKIDVVNQEKDRLSVQCEEQKGLIEKLENDNKKLLENCEVFSSESSVNKDKHQQFMQLEENYKIRVSALQSETQILKKDQDSLNDLIKAQNQEKDNAQARFNVQSQQLKIDNQELNLQIGSLNEQINILKNQVSGLQGQLEHANTSYEYKEEKYKENVQQLELIIQENANLKVEIQKVQSSLVTSQNVGHESQTQYNKMVSENEKLQMEIQRLYLEIETYKNDKITEQTRSVKVKEQVSQLEGVLEENTSLKKENQVLKREIIVFETKQQQAIKLEDLEKVQSENTFLKQEVHQLKQLAEKQKIQENAFVHEKVQSLTLRMENLMEENQTLKTESEKTEIEHTSQIQSIQSSFEGMDYKTIQTENSELKVEVKRLQKIIESKEEYEQQESDRKVGDYVIQLQKITNENSQLKTELELVQKQSPDSLKDQPEGFKPRDIDSYELENQQLKLEIQKLKQSYDGDTGTEYIIQNQKIQEYELELERISRENEQLKAGILLDHQLPMDQGTDKRENINFGSINSGQLQQENSQLKQEIQSIKQYYEGGTQKEQSYSDHKIQQYEVELQKANTEKQQLQEQILQTQSQPLEQDGGHMQQENSQLKQEIQNIKQYYEGANYEEQSYSDHKIQKLEVELQKANNEQQKLQEQILQTQSQPLEQVSGHLQQENNQLKQEIQNIRQYYEGANYKEQSYSDHKIQKLEVELQQAYNEQQKLQKQILQTQGYPLEQAGRNVQQENSHLKQEIQNIKQYYEGGNYKEQSYSDHTIQQYEVELQKANNEKQKLQEQVLQIQRQPMKQVSGQQDFGIKNTDFVHLQQENSFLHQEILRLKVFHEGDTEQLYSTIEQAQKMKQMRESGDINNQEGIVHLQQQNSQLKKEIHKLQVQFEGRDEQDHTFFTQVQRPNVLSDYNNISSCTSTDSLHLQQENIQLKQQIHKLQVTYEGKNEQDQSSINQLYTASTNDAQDRTSLASTDTVYLQQQNNQLKQQIHKLQVTYEGKDQYDFSNLVQSQQPNVIKDAPSFESTDIVHLQQESQQLKQEIHRLQVAYEGKDQNDYSYLVQTLQPNSTEDQKDVSRFDSTDIVRLQQESSQFKQEIHRLQVAYEGKDPSDVSNLVQTQQPSLTKDQKDASSFESTNIILLQQENSQLKQEIHKLQESFGGKYGQEYSSFDQKIQDYEKELQKVTNENIKLKAETQQTSIQSPFTQISSGANIFQEPRDINSYEQENIQLKSEIQKIKDYYEGGSGKDLSYSDHKLQEQEKELQKVTTENQQLKSKFQQFTNKPVGSILDTREDETSFEDLDLVQLKQDNIQLKQEITKIQDFYESKMGQKHNSIDRKLSLYEKEMQHVTSENSDLKAENLQIIQSSLSVMSSPGKKQKKSTNIEEQVQENLQLRLENKQLRAEVQQIQKKNRALIQEQMTTISFESMNTVHMQEENNKMKIEIQRLQETMETNIGSGGKGLQGNKQDFVQELQNLISENSQLKAEVQQFHAQPQSLSRHSSDLKVDLTDYKKLQSIKYENTSLRSEVQKLEAVTVSMDSQSQDDKDRFFNSRLENLQTENNTLKVQIQQLQEQSQEQQNRDAGQEQIGGENFNRPKIPSLQLDPTVLLTAENERLQAEVQRLQNIVESYDTVNVGDAPQLKSARVAATDNDLLSPRVNAGLQKTSSNVSNQQLLKSSTFTKGELTFLREQNKSLYTQIDILKKDVNDLQSYVTDLTNEKVELQQILYDNKDTQETLNQKSKTISPFENEEIDGSSRTESNIDDSVGSKADQFANVELEGRVNSKDRTFQAFRETYQSLIQQFPKEEVMKLLNLNDAQIQDNHFSNQIRSLSSKSLMDPSMLDVFKRSTTTLKDDSSKAKEPVQGEDVLENRKVNTNQELQTQESSKIGAGSIQSEYQGIHEANPGQIRHFQEKITQLEDKVEQYKYGQEQLIGAMQAMDSEKTTLEQNLQSYLDRLDLSLDEYVDKEGQDAKGRKGWFNKSKDSNKVNLLKTKVKDLEEQLKNVKEEREMLKLKLYSLAMPSPRKDPSRTFDVMDIKDTNNEEFFEEMHASEGIQKALEDNQSLSETVILEIMEKTKLLERENNKLRRKNQAIESQNLYYRTTLVNGKVQIGELQMESFRLKRAMIDYKQEHKTMKKEFEKMKQLVQAKMPQDSSHQMQVQKQFSKVYEHIDKLYEVQTFVTDDDSPRIVTAGSAIPEQDEDLDKSGSAMDRFNTASSIPNPFENPKV